jgi:hypothetical protein
MVSDEREELRDIVFACGGPAPETHRVVAWRGTLVEELSREDLVNALSWMAYELDRCRKLAAS